MSKKNIYDNDLGYDILRPIVDWHIKHSYRELQVVGKENIPTDGAVLFTPNHCNTLMDALVVLRSDKGSTVFGARADMFNRPLIARIMFFLRILPMVRQRDGLRNVLKNHESIETIVETLEHNVPFCIFPEGRHRAMHSQLPLGKGAFRAAIAANTRFGTDRPIYIVPVGIEYGDYFRYRSTSLLTFGKPINVTEFVKTMDTENEAQMMEPLRKELASSMQELITYIKDDEDYAAKWELTKIATLGFKGSLHDKMLNNKKVIAGIENRCAENPEQMQSLLAEVSEFEKERRSKGISIYSFEKKKPCLNALIKGLIALIGLPYFIFCSIVSLPMWGIFEILKTIIKDKAFRNTAGFGVYLVGQPVFGLIWTILAFCLAPWYYALAFVILMIPAYTYFYDYIEYVRIFISDIRLLCKNGLKKKFESIKTKLSFE